MAFASDQSLVLPSALEAHLQEMLEHEADSGPTFRYRFVSPDFDKSRDYDVTANDLETLCHDWALPDLGEKAVEGVMIVVSLADAPSEFGTATPGIAQVFEAYRVENGRCIWEVF